MPKRPAEDDGAEQARSHRERLPASLAYTQPAPKRAKTAAKKSSGRDVSSLPSRASFRGLPLELREMIYAFFFDGLVQEPQHPYSAYPLNSRFEGYLNLLLVDSATSAEAKQVFDKDYAKRITFYFEDAVSLYDFRRRADAVPVLKDVEFVLRSRYDLDPLGELDDWIQWMNETLFESYHNGFKDAWPEAFVVRGTAVRDDAGGALSEEFRLLVAKDNKSAIDYDEIAYPPLNGSLRVTKAQWRMKAGSHFSVRRQKLIPELESVSVTTFRGKVSDVSFADFPVMAAKKRLMKVLRDCPWPWFRKRYEGKYPVSQAEYRDFIEGKVSYWWPVSDIVDDHYQGSPSEASSRDDTDEDSSSESSEDDSIDSGESGTNSSSEDDSDSSDDNT